MSTVDFQVPERQQQQEQPMSDYEPDEDYGREVNVGRNERLLSAIGGGALVLAGLSRRSLPGLALAALGGALVHRGISGHCMGYAALGIDTSDEHRTDGASPQKYFHRGIHVEESLTIEKPAAELYAFWHDFTNLPRFMRHLDAVTCDGNKSHWTARGPAGMSIEWDAEIINDEPDTLIAWRSLGGADVDSAGSVRFVQAPGDRGTEVRVVLDYIPPAGRLGSTLAKLFGKAPEQTIREDLRRFKRLMEAGEIPNTAGQPHGEHCQ